MENRLQRRTKKETSKKEIEQQSTKKRSPLLWAGSVVILVIIVVALVFAPVLQIVGSSNEITFGSYGNRDISMRWGDSSNHMYQYISNSDSNSLTSDFAVTMLWNRAFESAAHQEAFSYYLDKAEAEVSRDRLNELVANHYTADGVFLKEQYLNTSPTEIRTLEKQLESQQKMQYLSNGLFSYAILPQGQLDLIADLQKEKRNFSYMVVSKSTYPEDLAQEYVHNNPDMFSSADISMITFIVDENQPLSTVEAEYAKIMDDPAYFQTVLDSAADTDGVYTQEKTTGSYAGLRTRFVNNEELKPYFLEGTVGDISPLMEGTNSTYSVMKITGEPEPLLAMGSTGLISSTIMAESPEVMDAYLEKQSKAILDQLASGGTMEMASEKTGIDSYTAMNNTFQYNGSALASANYFGMGGIQGSDSQNLFSSSSLTKDQITELFSMEKGAVTTFDTVAGTMIVSLDDIIIEEEQDTFLMEYGYSVADNQLRTRSIENNIMESDLLKNNFTKTFQSKVLGN